jgi:hypothetical protein
MTLRTTHAMFLESELQAPVHQDRTKMFAAVVARKHEE